MKTFEQYCMELLGYVPTEDDRMYTTAVDAYIDYQFDTYFGG